MIRPLVARAALLLILAAGTSAAGQAPDTDIFLVPLERDGRVVAGAVRNLTQRPGYDNQPTWSRDGRTLFFTSVREGEQADIYRLDLATGALTRVTTTTPESEYSATPVPGRNAISVIRVERDSTQRLWSVPLDGSAGAVILERIKPVGYHTWANDTLLALFVLGSPNTLQLASTTSGRGDTIVTSIGRSLHTRPDGQVSFVHKAGPDEWWLTLLNPRTRDLRRLVQMPRRVEDLAWLPDGRVLVGEGSVLKVWDPARGGSWETFADLGPSGLTAISRLAVSPRGDALAVVAQPAAPGRGPSR